MDAFLLKAHVLVVPRAVRTLCGHIGNCVVLDLYTPNSLKRAYQGPEVIKTTQWEKPEMDKSVSLCLAFSVVVKFYRATPPCCVPVCGVVNYNTTQNSHEAFLRLQAEKA